MNVEIGTETAQFPEKEYINGIFVAVHSPIEDKILLITCICKDIISLFTLPVPNFIDEQVVFRQESRSTKVLEATWSSIRASTTALVLHAEVRGQRLSIRLARTGRWVHG
jgi:hypothetical protein